MILYTDKIPETPDDCIFFQYLLHGNGNRSYGCVLTDGPCGLSFCERPKCDCLGLLPDGYSEDI